MLNQKSYGKLFEGKVRVRVCGILKEDHGILLLKHNKIGPKGFLWSPPGGGVEFGDNLQKTLIREFKEETNLKIEVKEYLFSSELIDDRHHAIELFFHVKRMSGKLRLGKDPELPDNQQILADARFFSSEELNDLSADTIHNAFLAAGARDKITELRGLITFKH